MFVGIPIIEVFEEYQKKLQLWRNFWTLEETFEHYLDKLVKKKIKITIETVQYIIIFCFMPAFFSDRGRGSKMNTLRISSCF